MTLDCEAPNFVTLSESLQMKRIRFCDSMLRSQPFISFGERIYMRRLTATFALLLSVLPLFSNRANAQETASSAQLKTYSCETKLAIDYTFELFYRPPKGWKTSKRLWLINASSAANAVTAAQSLAYTEGLKEQEGKSPAEYFTTCTAR